MNQFEKVQTLWEQQKDAAMPANGAAVIVQKTLQLQNKIKLRHISTMLILSITVCLLGWYFYVYALHADKNFIIGLLMMILTLLVRVFSEYLSLRHLQQISILQSMQQYSQQLILFYKRRFRIHYLVTPVVYGLYIIGFILLLPVFYQQFSTAFFVYIICSATAFFLVFPWSLRKKINQELKLLNELKKLHQKLEEE